MKWIPMDEIDKQAAQKLTMISLPLIIIGLPLCLLYPDTEVATSTLVAGIAFLILGWVVLPLFDLKKTRARKNTGRNRRGLQEVQKDDRRDPSRDRRAGM